MNIFIINLINLFMRKSIFKLMSAAFALAAVTSCSDDLSLQSNKIDSNADLVAAFDGNDDVKTRLGMLEVEGANPWDQGNAAGWSWVFTKNDKLRVFTMASMEYQNYQLVPVPVKVSLTLRPNRLNCPKANRSMLLLTLSSLMPSLHYLMALRD